MKFLFEGRSWRVVLVVMAALISWKIITINLADYYVGHAVNGDQAAISSALLWDDEHPRALTMHAVNLISSGLYKQAEEALSKAIQLNPADTRPLMMLANLRRELGEVDIADQMVVTVNRLMPVDARIQRAVAIYWYERDKLDLAVKHLATAMSAEGKLRGELFPIFLEIAEGQSTRIALSPLTLEPPLWWEKFFAFATKNAEEVDTLRALVAMRKDSESYLLTEYERNVYINRLRKDGLLAEAYLHWVNGLSKDARESLAYIYNGNFEREFSNSGFGWYAKPPKKSGIIINTAKTFGIVEKKALYLSFKGKRVKFNHLRQSLFLSPGSYHVTGQVRPAKLKARKGLRWVVLCTVGSPGLLAVSPSFKGTSDWREFEFDIIVPPECEGQLLRLQSVGNRDVDHEIKGEIWFDDMHIKLMAHEIELEAEADIKLDIEADSNSDPEQDDPDEVVESIILNGDHLDSEQTNVYSD